MYFLEWALTFPPLKALRRSLLVELLLALQTDVSALKILAIGILTQDSPLYDYSNLYRSALSAEANAQLIIWSWYFGESEASLLLRDSTMRCSKHVTQTRGEWLWPCRHSSSSWPSFLCMDVLTLQGMPSFSIYPVAVFSRLHNDYDWQCCLRWLLARGREVEGDNVIKRFIDTDEKVSDLSKSKLTSWRPSGSNGSRPRNWHWKCSLLAMEVWPKTCDVSGQFAFIFPPTISSSDNY